MGLSDLVPDEHPFSLTPPRPSAPRHDTTHSMYWKRSPASNTLLPTYLGADAMAKGRWWKRRRLKRTVKTARDLTLVEIRAAEIQVKASRVVASPPHRRYEEMFLMLCQRGEVVPDPQIVCYW